MSQQQARVHRAAPEIPVLDVDEARSYYDQRLGFHTKSVMPDGDYAVVERDDVALHLFRSDPPCHPLSFHVFTSNADALFAELSARGANIIQPLTEKPWGMRDFRISDPWGNEIKFSEPQG